MNNGITKTITAQAIEYAEKIFKVDIRDFEDTMLDAEGMGELNIFFEQNTNDILVSYEMEVQTPWWTKKMTTKRFEIITD